MKKDKYVLVDRKYPNAICPIDYEVPCEPLRYKIVDTTVGWGMVVCYILDEDIGKSIVEILNNLTIITQMNKKNEVEELL